MEIRTLLFRYSFFLVVLLIFQQAAAENYGKVESGSLNPIWGDDDTVIIEAINSESEVAEHERQKRQLPLLTVAVSPPRILIRGPAAPSRPGEACHTPSRQPGTCTPLKQCYAFMYSFDMDNDGIYEGNLELARMLTESSGSCTGNFYNAEGGSLGAEDLVCCTLTNVTKLDVPPLIPVTFNVGGHPAPKGAYPAMVALMNNGRQFCGASVIDRTHVLTAAHCVAHMGGVELSRVTAQIGDHDIYSTSDGTHEVRKIRRIIKHRQFNRQTLVNDIALLTLSTPVQFSSRIQPIGLSSSSGASAVVAGWGKLFENGQFPSVLHHVTIGLLSNQRCAQIYGRLAPGGITPEMLCGGSSAADACSGDSGGPLMVGGRQIGIVSWGIGCGRYPGVYTRVSSFLSWIQKNQAN